MLESQNIEIERINVQQKLNAPGLLEMRSDDPDFESHIGERKALQEQLHGLNERLIKAYQSEDQEAQLAMASHINPDGLTAEQREFHALGQRTRMEEYMQAGLQQRPLTPGTPEHEYNSHIFGSNFSIGDYPLEMLLNREEFFNLEAHQAKQVFEKEMEQRTEITGVVGTAGNLSFVDRIFANSEGAYCRAAYPAVGPGRHSYPIVTGTANVGEVVARGTAETVAGGLTVVNADPERIQHSFEVARADELQMPGIMAYLASDITAGLIAGLDKKVIVDLVAGLTYALQTGGTTATQATFFAAIATGVDGIGARYFGELRVLGSTLRGGTSFYEKAISFIGAADNSGAFDFLSNLRASAYILSKGAGIGQAILVKMAPSAPRLIVPVWRRAEILRDTGRLQLQGAVTLTGAIYADVIIAAEDMHDLIGIDTA